MIPKTSWVIKLRNQVMQSSLVCHKRRLSITPSACCQARRPATNAIATSPACWRLRHDVRQPPAGRPGGVAVFTVLDGSVLAQFQSWFLKLSDSLDELLHRNSSGTSQPQEMAVARRYCHPILQGIHSGNHRLQCISWMLQHRRASQCPGSSSPDNSQCQVSAVAPKEPVVFPEQMLWSRSFNGGCKWASVHRTGYGSARCVCTSHSAQLWTIESTTAPAGVQIQCDNMSVQQFTRHMSQSVSDHRHQLLLEEETDRNRPSWRDEVVINRLHFGHARVTHSYLLPGAYQPECMTCQCPLTVMYSSLNMLILMIQQLFYCLNLTHHIHKTLK